MQPNKFSCGYAVMRLCELFVEVHERSFEPTSEQLSDAAFAAAHESDEVEVLWHGSGRVFCEEAQGSRACRISSAAVG